MKPHLFRVISVSMLLACLLAPSLSAGTPPPGSAERIATLEAELKAMQAEAAKDPSRPTVAETERRLNRMLAERRSSTRPAPWTIGSLGLNLALTLALLWALGRRRRA